MTAKDALTDAVSTSSKTYSLSSFFTVSGTSGNPAYLVVSALDRDEYTAGASTATGSFSANGTQLGLSADGGDARAADIIYTWQASTDSYVNSSFGSLSALDYTSSASLNDVTNISFYGCTTLAQANQLAGSPYALMQNDASGYLGSTSFVTDPNDTTTPPANATPDSIAAVAARFVGDAWNMDGCWVLASTIAAEAGSGLPVQSTSVGLAGQANGAWYVVYNGPVAVNANWQSLLTPGDIVVIATGGNSGHITTVVSGSGSNAALIDNITYIGANGQIANSAHDGSANDILVAAAHAAAQEFSGISANSVVVYGLDVPGVTDTKAAVSANWGGTLSLSGVATAKDPAGKSIADYQVYLGSSADSLLDAGKLISAHSAASAVTVTSLASLSFVAGADNTTSTTGTDTIYIRASNGSYWGDWQTLGVSLSAAAPHLAAQTAAQSWQQGTAVNFALPSGTFTDPQSLALTYSVAGAGGAALPSWLSFNAKTLTFTGTVPTGLASFAVAVTATDTLGLSSTETFTVNVPAVAPLLAHQMSAQSVTANKAVSFALPSGSFTDPQGETLTLTASLASGAALPSWLQFNASTGSFSGTATTTTGPVAVKVTATDSSHLSVSETFTVTVQASAPQASSTTLGETLTLGQTVNFALPSGSFSDPQGEQMTFAATLSTGAALPSWLHFNTATGSFTGTAPSSQAALDLKITATDASKLSASETLILDFAPAGATNTGAFTMAAGSAGGTFLPDLHDVAPGLQHFTHHG